MSRLDVLVAREGKNGKTHWTKVGAAFPNRDGVGFKVILDALPINGELHLRAPLPPRDGRGSAPPKGDAYEEPDAGDTPNW